MEWLTKEYGPLPGWGWLAAIGLGLAVSFYVRSQMGETDIAEDRPDTARPVGAGPDGPIYGHVPTVDVASLVGAANAVNPSVNTALNAIRERLSDLSERDRTRSQQEAEQEPEREQERDRDEDGQQARQRRRERQRARARARRRRERQRAQERNRRRPRDGWSLVRDNLNAVFVVHWPTERRYRVQPREVARARRIFGVMLTRASQIPASARNAQNAMLNDIARNEGRDLPEHLIYLDRRMGWSDEGVWQPQTGTRA